MKECTVAFRSCNRSRGIDCPAIIVSGVEVGVVVSALQLEAGFQDF
jgi:hypothetical protein